MTQGRETADSPAPPVHAKPVWADRSLSLGVLLVHGIGEQHRGDTLVTWLDAIVATINEATRKRASAAVEWADLASRSDEAGRAPAHALVRIHGDGIDERWLVAEAWWAETFVAPSFSELVTWSFRSIPWTIAMHAAQRYRRSGEQTSGLHKFFDRMWAAAQVLMALFLAPFVVLALALLLLVGLLPISSLRTMVGGVQRVLAATAGDSMVFIESPVRSAAMCSEVLTALGWLRRTCALAACERSVVLAHSQGATVTLEALGRIEAAPASERSSSSVLVTFGAGINKLAALRSFGEPAESSDGTTPESPQAFYERDPIRAASVCLLACALIGGWFWQLIATGQLTLTAMWLVPAVWFGGSLTLGAMVTGSQSLVRRFGDGRAWLSKALIAATVAVSLVIIGGGFVFAERSQTPVMPFVFLVMVLAVLVGTLRLTLSESLQERVVQRIRIPAAVGTWVDYWASADPVPNGSTRSPNPSVPASMRTWNEASLLRDHTTYWQNRDGFTLPIVRILAGAAQSAWQTDLPPETDSVVARAEWRTGWLRALRWLVSGAFLLVGLQRGTELDMIRLHVVGAADLFGVARWLSWVPSWLWALTFRWGVVAGSAWLAYRLLLALWHAWVRAEQDQVLHHNQPTGTPMALRMLGGVATLIIAAALYVARTDWAAMQSGWATGDLVDVAFFWVIAVWSQVLVWLVVKIFPPPSGRVQGP